MSETKEKRVIEQYVDAMVEGDWTALADCFEPACRFFDFCPIGYQQTNYNLYGKPAIEMFYYNRFFFKYVVVSDPVIQDDMTADYLIAYTNQNMHVQAKIEKLSENGLIKEMVIRPA